MSRLDCGIILVQPSALLVGEDRKLPYDTLAECYCVAQLRQKARIVIGQFGQHRIDLSKRGPLHRLYSSREEYRSITNEAWSRFINGPQQSCCGEEPEISQYRRL